MKEKVELADVFRRTSVRFAHIDRAKFDVLYHGWCRAGIRHGRNAQIYTTIRQRGWMSLRDAEDFERYIGLR